MLARRGILRSIKSYPHKRMAHAPSAAGSRDTSPRIYLVLDWDGTLTTKDTLHLVSDIGYTCNASRYPPLPPWNDIVSAYLQDLDTHERSYNRDRSTIAGESDWLASLATVESRSVQRVEKAGIFQGVRTDHIRRKACEATSRRELELRDGWDDLLFIKNSGHISFGILSVNWSGCFIRFALEYAAISTPQLPSRSLDNPLDLVYNIPINANEIQSLGDSSRGSSGLLSPPGHAGIRTSKDKLAELVTLSSAREMQTSEGTPHEGIMRPTLVYVGDSTTDFDCLIFADIGICVRDDPIRSSQNELAATFEKVGVRLEPLGNLQQLPSQKADRKKVWWVKNLKEIVDLISRLESQTATW